MPLHGFVQGRAGWPNIEPFNIRVPVNLASEKVVIDVPIKNPTGRVLYHFACRGGAEAYLNSLPGNWVGPLMCILAEGDKPTEESLLSEDDSAAWFSRGQFRREELVGDCAKYPEFGVHRSFRLRGFRLTLDVQDVMADERGIPQSFVLAISLQRDPVAKATRAERPGFLDPRHQGGSCSVVVRGQEPRMCRDANGSWARCK